MGLGAGRADPGERGRRRARRHPGRRDHRAGQPRARPGRRERPGGAGRRSRSPRWRRWPNGPRCPRRGRSCSAPGPARSAPRCCCRPGTSPGRARLPVLVDPYGGPHAQRVLSARGAYLTPQWFAEQGFARGDRGRPRHPGPRARSGNGRWPATWPARCWRTRWRRWPRPRPKFADLDTSRVAIRGWSFGGYLAALAVLRRPDVFHAADRGRAGHRLAALRHPLHRALPGRPGQDTRPTSGPRCSIWPNGRRSRGPLMLIHGLADDNVVVAHTLRLSGALLAAGYPHTVLPLSGITHMASQETVAENLLLLQLDFLRRARSAHDRGQYGPNSRLPAIMKGHGVSWAGRGGGRVGLAGRRGSGARKGAGLDDGVGSAGRRCGDSAGPRRAGPRSGWRTHPFGLDDEQHQVGASR